MARLPASARIGRVALDVADLDAAASFYAETVGFGTLASAEDQVTLGAGDGALLELRAAPGAAPRPATAAGMFHLAVRVPSRGALGDALERLRASGRLTGASDHLVSEALYARDPAGNGVEVYRDRPREDWERDDDGRPRIDTLPLDTGEVAAAASGARAVPADTAVGHVHLEVTDLDRARAFYVDALGLAPVDRMDGALFAAAGDYHHHIGLNVWNGRSAPATGRGLAWFELVVPGEDARAAAAERLADAGYDVGDVDDGGGLAVTDPDGIEVRLVAPG